MLGGNIGCKYIEIISKHPETSKDGGKFSKLTRWVGGEQPVSSHISRTVRG